MRLTFETWIRDQCTTTSEFNIARRAWQACESALTRERDEARAAKDELILRCRCGCEVCSHTSQLCPATASSIAMEQTYADASIAGAYREAANCLRKRQHVVGNVEAILALTPAAAIRAKKLLVAQAVIKEVNWWKTRTSSSRTYFRGIGISKQYREECERFENLTAALEEIKKEMADEKQPSND